MLTATKQFSALLLELYTAVLPADFSVSVICLYQICWIFGISVGIDPPLFRILPPFPPPFFPNGVELLKKGAIAPLLRKKGGTAPFLIPKSTEFSFGIGMVNTEKYRPNTDRKYRIGIQLYYFYYLRHNF